MPQMFANYPSTTLSGAITAGALSITVNSSVGFPSSGNFQILLDQNEIAQVTAVSGNTWTVTRAFESLGGVQSAYAHNNGAPVVQVFTAGSISAGLARIDQGNTFTGNQIINGTLTGLTGLTVASGGATISGSLAIDGLTGAVQPTRYVGSTTWGPPTSGTFSIGDFIISAIGGVWICVGAGTPGTWRNSNIGVYNVREYGAVVDGITDDVTAIKSAITAANSAGGGIVLVPGQCLCASALTNLDQSGGVILTGLGGINQASPVSRLIYSGGAGAANFIQATSSSGFGLQNIYVTNSNSAFNGFLLDLGHSVNVDSAYTVLNNVLFGGTGTAVKQVNLTQVIDFTAIDCVFSAGALSISASTYANDISFIRCNFQNFTGVPIQITTGQSWRFDDCRWEALLNGQAGAITATGINALTISSPWMGDVTGTASTWVSFGGNSLKVNGGYIAGNSNSTAISITGSSNFGIYILGTILSSHAVGVALGAAVNGPVDIRPIFISCTTNITGTPTSGFVENALNGGSGGARGILNYTQFKARMFQTNAQSAIANASLTNLILDTVDYDGTGAMCSTVSPGTITVPVAGQYMVVAGVGWSLVNAPTMIGIFINGVGTRFESQGGNASGGGMGVRQQVPAILHLAAGDAITVQIRQDSGGAAAPQPGTTLSYLEVMYLGT